MKHSTSCHHLYTGMLKHKDNAPFLAKQFTQIKTSPTENIVSTINIQTKYL